MTNAANGPTFHLKVDGKLDVPQGMHNTVDRIEKSSEGGKYEKVTL